MLRFDLRRGGFQARVGRLGADVRRAVRESLLGAMRAWAAGTLPGGAGLPRRTMAGAVQRYGFARRITDRYRQGAEAQYGAGVAYRSPRRLGMALSLLAAAKMLAGRGDVTALLQQVALERRLAGRPNAADQLAGGGVRVRAQAGAGTVRVSVAIPAFRALNQGRRGGTYARELRELRRGREDLAVAAFARELLAAHLRTIAAGGRQRGAA